jgi:hypothetical protein
MTEATYNRLQERLIKEINAHPYREELIKLMEEQLVDDSYTVNN